MPIYAKIFWGEGGQKNPSASVRNSIFFKLKLVPPTPQHRSFDTKRQELTV